MTLDRGLVQTFRIQHFTAQYDFMQNFMTLLFCLFSASIAQADYLPLPIQPGESIRVYGNQGRLEIVMNPPGQVEHLRVKSTSTQPGRDFSVQMEHKGKVFEIRSKEESQDLVLSLNPRSVYISWLRGQVDVFQWKAPIEIYMEKGKLNLLGGGGSRVITGHEVRLNMEHEKGPFKISVYDLIFSGRYLAGLLKMDGSRIQGELAQSESQVNWQFWNGSLKVKKSEGKVYQYVARAGETTISP